MFDELFFQMFENNSIVGNPQFREKAKSLNDKMSKKHLFSSNEIFSLRPSPQRGSQFDDFTWNRGIVSSVR